MQNFRFWGGLLLGTLLLVPAHAQYNCFDGRFYAPVFAQTQTLANIQFGEAKQPTILNPNAVQKLYLDLYQPQGDTLARRPLVILAFGGAFVFGSRTSPDIVTLAQRLGKLGYLVASVDYRLTPELALGGNPDLARTAVLKAAYDVRAAVRFFRKDAATDNNFRIDTAHIYVGGVSAGSIAALHAAYLNDLSELMTLGLDTTGLGGVEGLSGNPGYSSAVHGVINYCGGLGELSYLDAGEPPLASLHGDQDDVVPYATDTVTLFNLNLPISGSAAIHPHALATGVASTLHTSHGEGHVPFVQSLLSTPQAHMDTAFWLAREFLFPFLCPGVAAGVATASAQPQLAPNPMTTEATLPLPTPPTAGLLLRLYDALGRPTPLHYRLDQAAIVLQRGDLQPGLYTLHVQQPGAAPLALRLSVK